MTGKRKRSNNDGGRSSKRRRVNFAALPNAILGMIARQHARTYYRNRRSNIARHVRQVAHNNPGLTPTQLRNFVLLSTQNYTPAEINHVITVLRARNEV